VRYAGKDRALCRPPVLAKAFIPQKSPVRYAGKDRALCRPPVLAKAFIPQKSPVRYAGKDRALCRLPPLAKASIPQKSPQAIFANKYAQQCADGFCGLALICPDFFTTQSESVNPPLPDRTVP
jgi:hypothetical protein